MFSLDITLSATDKVRSFVNLANQYPCHIYLRQGRATVDAKSVLGVFSLDLTQPITVDVYCDHHQELLDALDAYAR